MLKLRGCFLFSVALVLLGLSAANEVGDIPSNTKLCLYSKNMDKVCQKIVVGDLSTINDSDFDFNRTTKLLLPGWLDPAYDFEGDVKKAYLDAKDINLITFDWNYYTLVQNFMYIEVGKYLASFIDWLVGDVGVSLKSLHVVGFSLGGELAGVVGEHVTAGKIGRITGLDPVGLTFNTTTALDPFDAEFVDVIHTCGGYLGWNAPAGHVDFYPNSGSYNQPGCVPLDFGVCSHIRAFKLFIESMTSDKFVATQCNSWADYELNLCSNNANTTIMGENVDKSARGLFFLRTAGSPPFAKG